MKRRRQPKTPPRSEPKPPGAPPAVVERPGSQRRLRVALVMLATAAVAAVIYHRGNEPPASPSPVSSPAESADAGAQQCQACHAEIYEKYQQVPMAQTLSRAMPQNVIEDYARNNRFFHEASDRHYEMAQRDGKFYQRRYQLDKDGNPTNIFEREAHYIIGSGRHARSYLHRSENGELTQLPITWYTQENSWGMSPGYDKPKHFDFSRRIDHDCMFCHNAYFPVPQASDAYGAEPRFPAALPTGIDCQRCHGPGNAHIEKASSGKASQQEIQAAIVNPARLDAPRQMDVCLQCHLETTSAELPHALKRFGRTAYSYRPGESLTDYIVHFDHAPGAGRGGKFEFVGSRTPLLAGTGPDFDSSGSGDRGGMAADQRLLLRSALSFAAWPKRIPPGVPLRFMENSRSWASSFPNEAWRGICAWFGDAVRRTSKRR
jgi:hypothetical protein